MYGLSMTRTKPKLVRVLNSTKIDIRWVPGYEVKGASGGKPPGDIPGLLFELG